MPLANHETSPIYGERPYLDDTESELVARTRGHRLAVQSDRDLSDVSDALVARCSQLKECRRDVGTPAARDDLQHKLGILAEAMTRVRAEADRRNLRLAAADLNAFIEDLLGTDLDKRPHRRGSAETFVQTASTPRPSEA